MKKYNDLWDKICTLENFYEAYRKAVKGKKYYRDVKYIRSYGVKKYLRELLDEVVTGRYRVSKYTIFHKMTGGKDREIYRLPMKDRIVQHAIMIHIEPIFRENFIVDTFSSIKGRGIHAGLKRVKRAVKDEDYKYAIKLDIKKCYPSLDQNILKEKLAKKFTDPKLLDLLFKIVDSCDKGVPIGNYTSQYFNNFYFSDFDHWLKETKRVKYYFRYCDDMIILGKTKEELHDLLVEIQQQIDDLHVTLKPNYQIFPIEDRSVDFLGYKVRSTHILLRKKTKYNFKRKTSRMDFTNLSDKDLNILGSYWGILSHADCRTLWRQQTYAKAKGKEFPYSGYKNNK